MSNLIKKDKGFTLIEIVLVLAIAGLLLVIVFLAVSGAQKSRRDTQRKQDVSRVAAALESYASNYSGGYPTNVDFANAAATGTSFGPYRTGITTTPDGGAYTYSNAATLVPAKDTFSLNFISSRVYNVCVGLEQGYSCRSNQ